MIMRVLNRSLMGTLVLIAFFWAGCKKEITPTNFDEIPTKSEVSSITTNGLLNVENAKKLVEAKKLAISERDGTSPFADLTYYWNSAISTNYKGEVPILFIPVKTTVENSRALPMMAFFVKEQVLDSRLFVIVGDNPIDLDNPITPQFYGLLLQVNWDGTLVGSVRIDGGIITGPVNPVMEDEANICPDGSFAMIIEDTNGNNDVICVDAYGMGIININNDVIGGDEGVQSDPFGFNSTGSTSSGGGGGNGSYSLNNYFNLDDFSGISQKNAQLINTYKAEYGLYSSSAQIQSQLISNCGLPPESDPFGLHGELIEVVNGDILPCEQAVINADRTLFFQEVFGINISNTQLAAITAAGVNTNSANFLTLFTSLGLNSTQVGSLIANPSLLGVLYSKAQLNGFNQETITISKFFIDLVRQNAFPINPNNSVYQQVATQYFGDILVNEDGIIEVLAALVMGQYTQIESAKLKFIDKETHTYKYADEHGNQTTWQKLSLAYDATSNLLHIELDLGGLIPVVGEVCDITNGVIYTIEGNYTDGAMSFGSSIPFVGWFTTGAKYAEKIITVGDVVRKLTWISDAAGTVTFGSRSFLRKVINAPTGTQAHHIIPWESRYHGAIQSAAKKNGTNPFHMNNPTNGVALGPVQHWGSHTDYSNAITNRLDYIENTYGLGADICEQKVTILANKVREIILQNPNLRIDNPIVANKILQIQL